MQRKVGLESNSNPLSLFLMEDFIQSEKSLSISVNNCLQESFNRQSFLFHKPSFVYRNPDIKTFQICLNINGDTVAGININLIGQKAQSQYKSPFGSVWGLKELTNEQLDFLIRQILSWCKELELAELIIKGYPFCYDTQNSALLINSLTTNGFQLEAVEINQHIEVGGKDFIQKIIKFEQKKLRKCKREGFTFRICSQESLKEAYGLIRSVRKQKGYPVTMEYFDLKRMFEQFPDNYVLFAAYNHNQMIATSVSIKINDKILYNFYHGHDTKYNHFSPILLVLEGIYSYCLKHNIEIIDLGISSDHSKVNPGLYQFKKNIGALESQKITFSKIIK